MCSPSAYRQAPAGAFIGDCYPLREQPGVLYFEGVLELGPNLLVIKIQPEEGVFLQFIKTARHPGIIVPVRMDYCQNCGTGLDFRSLRTALADDAGRLHSLYPLG